METSEGNVVVIEYYATDVNVLDLQKTIMPEPFHYGLLPWLWRVVTGWRDEYGRPPSLIFPWEE